MTISPKQRLFRAPDGLIAGICSGLAEFFGLDPSLVRIATLLLILFGGLSLWAYLILWIVIPVAPKSSNI